MSDLIAHLERQLAWSLATFGPGTLEACVIDHIRQELRELEQAPEDLEEWIDVVLLAFDGAWRQGYSPEEIAAALAAKQAKNEARTWPDWRAHPRDRAIEHVRSGEPPADRHTLPAVPAAPVQQSRRVPGVPAPAASRARGEG